MARGKVSAIKRSQLHFHLAHYADALFRSYEERLNSSEWQAAMRLRKHKVCYGTEINQRVIGSHETMVANQ